MITPAEVPTLAPPDQTKKRPAGEAGQKQHKKTIYKGYFSLLSPASLPPLTLQGGAT